MKNEKFREQRFSIWIIDDPEGDIRIKLTEDYLEVLFFFLSVTMLFRVGCLL